MGGPWIVSRSSSRLAASCAFWLASQPTMPRWPPRLALHSSCRTRSRGCGSRWGFEALAMRHAGIARGPQRYCNLSHLGGELLEASMPKLLETEMCLYDVVSREGHPSACMCVCACVFGCLSWRGQDRGEEGTLFCAYPCTARGLRDLIAGSAEARPWPSFCCTELCTD